MVVDKSFRLFIFEKDADRRGGRKRQGGKGSVRRGLRVYQRKFFLNFMNTLHINYPMFLER
jgi:hypothetical protein